MAAFLAAIEGTRAPAFDFAEGVKIERVIHAVARSADSAAWVTI